jgi:ADP-L-glycero-D-manno-heptose 6-epimerase
MNILITGSSGFIGAKLIGSLGQDYNLYTSDIINRYNHHNFFTLEKSLSIIKNMDIVVHLGAVSETMCLDKGNIFDKNISYTVQILNLLPKSCKLIFASSASVYGQIGFNNNEYIKYDDLSLYAKSKLLIDHIINNFFNDREVISLRFFNVCSFFDEEYKKQPSPTFRFLKQLKENKKIYLFNNSKNIYRDFIFIDDIINILKFFITKFQVYQDQKNIDIGSGSAISFESIADKLISKFGYGEKIYMNNTGSDFYYQKYTCADTSILRSLGYNQKIQSIINYIDLI